MAHRSGMRISTLARTLAVALALGGALLGLSVGEIAHAARPGMAEPGDMEPGGAPARTTGVVYREKTGDNGVRCSIDDGNGNVDFYLPGDTVDHPGYGITECGADGKWQPRTSPPSRGNRIPRPRGGGVYMP